jgi:alkylation response protein AidB-like acyl-CoA dehydrogenase
VDAAIAYTKGRKQFGKSISEFQAVQFMLADMAMKVEAARLMVYFAAARRARPGWRPSRRLRNAWLPMPRSPRSTRVPIRFSASLCPAPSRNEADAVAYSSAEGAAICVSMGCWRGC